MVLSKETLRRKYNNGGMGGKRGRPAKKEHPKAKEKRLRLEAAGANRSDEQTSKLRSSSANDVTCDVDVDVEPAPASARKSSASVCKASRDGASARKPSSVRAPTYATRATSRVQPQRDIAHVDRYVAGSSTPTRDGRNPWHITKVNHKLKIDILNLESKKLTASNYHYKRLSKIQEREITALNKNFLHVISQRIAHLIQMIFHGCKWRWMQRTFINLWVR